MKKALALIIAAGLPAPCGSSDTATPSTAASPSPEAAMCIDRSVLRKELFASFRVLEDQDLNDGTTLAESYEYVASLIAPTLPDVAEGFEAAAELFREADEVWRPPYTSKMLVDGLDLRVDASKAVNAALRDLRDAEPDYC
jgi:hypothetical protein